MAQPPPNTVNPVYRILNRHAVTFFCETLMTISFAFFVLIIVNFRNFEAPRQVAKNVNLRVVLVHQVY